MKLHYKLFSPVIALTACLTLLSSSTQAADKDIVDTAVANGNFTILAKALTAADLVGALKADGPYTVFAPTDEAFKRLPKGTLEALLKPENKPQLINILTYHVVKGKVDGATAVGLKEASALNGEKIKIAFKNAALNLNNSRVTATDIQATNGIIHVIDNVLIPKKTVAPIAQAAKTPKTKEGVCLAIFDEAVDTGVDLFNAGDTKACASIYKIAVMAVLEIKPKRLGKEEVNALREALKTTAKSDDTSQNAWTLRKAINKAYRGLNK